MPRASARPVRSRATMYWTVPHESPSLVEIWHAVQPADLGDLGAVEPGPSKGFNPVAVLRLGLPPLVRDPSRTVGDLYRPFFHDGTRIAFSLGVGPFATFGHGRIFQLTSGKGL